MKNKKWVMRILSVLLMLSVGMLLMPGCAQPELTETIELDSGKIKGKGADGYHYYLRIPFAAPPVGDLRWKPPQPVKPWLGVKESTEFGSSCPQTPIPYFTVDKMDEDCLYLNVWTPARSPGDRLPVMVWIHGGGFQWGSASEITYVSRSLDYDGASLAKKGVVVVTINYRVGVFGFLEHPQLAEESPEGLKGNYGMLDQIAALEWVQRNIAAFGGNPSRVTIFGESAGGMCVIALMQSPLTEGLFHRAIAESAPLLTGLFSPQAPDPEDVGRALASILGCDQAPDVLAAMRAKTPEEILAAIAGPPPMFFAPVGDGKVLKAGRLFMDTEYLEGPWHDVPLIIGSNANELGAMAPVDPSSPQQMAGFLQMFQPWESYVRGTFGERADSLLALFPADTPEDIRPALDHMFTAISVACPSKFVAEQLSSPTYVYQFTRVPDWEHSKTMGAFHGLEIGYVFGGPRMLMDQIEYEAEDKALSEMMMDYWTAFADTGDPNGPGRPHWPAYDPANDEHLELDAEVTVKSGLFKEVCDLLR